jgi:hypothetical protein
VGNFVSVASPEQAEPDRCIFGDVLFFVSSGTVAPHAVLLLMPVVAEGHAYVTVSVDDASTAVVVLPCHSLVFNHCSYTTASDGTRDATTSDTVPLSLIPPEYFAQVQEKHAACSAPFI